MGSNSRIIPLALSLFAASASVAACDIVQGFQNAGDALFPPVKTYLDTPGYQLVAGGYRDLNFVAAEELYLLARSSDPQDTSVYSMRYADPVPCKIPNAPDYFPAEAPDGGKTWIAYYRDSAGAELYFADPNCNQSSLVLPGANPPFTVRSWISPSGMRAPDSGRTLILRQSGDLVAVDPGDASREVLLERAEQIFQGVGGAGVQYVFSDGQIVAFDMNWRKIKVLGSNVSYMTAANGRLYYEDEGGIHRVTSSISGDITLVGDTVIDAEACGLNPYVAPSQRWLSFYSPCAENRLVVWPEDDGPAVPYDLPTEPWLMMLVPDPKPPTPGPVTPDLERLFAFYLRDVDYGEGVGTLVLRARGGDEIVLGARAAMERTSVANNGEYGYALVDADGTRGRYVRWFLDGTTEEVAADALRQSAQPDWARLIVDWNGKSGTLAKAVEGQLIRVLEGVPDRRYAYTDRYYTALFGDYDGTNGTLSIGEEVCPPDPPDCAGRHFAPRPVARGVRHPRHRLFNEVGDWLPAIGYLTAYDEVKRSGRFEYRNLELGFTSIINEGVSDFLMAGNGILYAVPHGADAGIWLARAK